MCLYSILTHEYLKKTYRKIIQQKQKRQPNKQSQQINKFIKHNIIAKKQRRKKKKRPPRWSPYADMAVQELRGDGVALGAVGFACFVFVFDLFHFLFSVVLLWYCYGFVVILLLFVCLFV